MKSVVIDDVGSLVKARQERDCDRVTITTARLKHRGLLVHAVKYGLWALRPGGELVIVDNGARDFETRPFRVPFDMVRGWVFQSLAGDAVLQSLDTARRAITLRRISGVTPPGWSAGVVFSGADGEIPQLMDCVAALVRQPELAAEADGDIVVCGPTRDTGFLREFPRVRYLACDIETTPRLMIGQKKNALMRALRHSKMLVLHTRIVLDSGCLSRLPDDFDLLALAVQVDGAGQRQLYLSLGVTDARTCGWPPRHATRTVRQTGADRYLTLFEHGLPYVDGGAFAVRRAVFERCPLDDHLAWGEAEDVEWSRRVAANGFLIDFAPEATALSVTNKLPHQSSMRHVPAPFTGAVRRTMRWGDWVTGVSRHLVERGLRQR